MTRATGVHQKILLGLSVALVVLGLADFALTFFVPQAGTLFERILGVSAVVFGTFLIIIHRRAD